MLNQVALVGRLTRDVDLRKTQAGKEVGQFILAVNRNYKNAQGNVDTDFITCQVWRNADVLSKYTHKGSLISITGQIQTGSYDNKQGQRVYTTDIVVDHFDFLESKNSDGQSIPHNQSQQRSEEQAPIISDDDLPF
ncbi:single-stranded DNA-binding protein [Schleiferilactobacillus perolens]|uniref:single-stranded DNA-binding protein n=1 Tax=Schleiferilactobacillus perolens TaxID=100468 RepID=UPI0039EC7CE0